MFFFHIKGKTILHQNHQNHHQKKITQIIIDMPNYSSLNVLTLFKRTCR